MSWWVYAPTWVISAGGLVYAYRADRRAKAADERAKEANARESSVETSLDRMATAMEGRLDAATRERISDALGRLPDLTALPPAFTAEFAGGASYRVRNVSMTMAHRLMVEVPGVPEGLSRHLPRGVDLAPLASTEPFLLISAMAHPRPGEVLVSCDELDEPVRVPLPPSRLPN